MSRHAAHLLFRAACLAVALGAFVLAVLPGDPSLFHDDKANHGLAFAVLGGLARLGWSRTAAWKPFLLLVAFGATIEIVQGTPLVHRDESWGDLLADTIAAAAGLALGTVAVALARRR